MPKRFSAVPKLLVGCSVKDLQLTCTVRRFLWPRELNARIDSLRWRSPDWEAQ